MATTITEMLDEMHRFMLEANLIARQGATAEERADFDARKMALMDRIIAA